MLVCYTHEGENSAADSRIPRYVETKLISPAFTPYFFPKFNLNMRQTSNSSWEFLNIENEKIKTAQNNSYRYKIA